MNGETAKRVLIPLPAMECSASLMTGLWLGSHYRTYPQMVEDEVIRALGPEGTFERGPFAARSDNAANPYRGFVVVDRNPVTARWPGDAHKFAHVFLETLKAR